HDCSHQEFLYPIFQFLTSVSLFLLVDFICCSRRAALPFAKGSAVVREEQRGRSRTANNFALEKMLIWPTFFKKRRCDFNVYRCCQDTNKVESDHP
ncbi:MAG: hypothetical protein IKJ09_07925, partial [Bacteroidaceae bacterium]|nr:hypothetical protein [Bacteroidaceae bacterium]